MESQKIWYLQLKTEVLSNLYPDRNIRYSCDRDYLFNNEFRLDVKNWFIKNGYKVETYEKNKHDVYTKKPTLNFEMHISLFSLENKKEWNSYYEKVIEKIISNSDHYKLNFTNEDFYVYLNAHNFNHYCTRGLGLKNLIDMYVFLCEYEGKLDFEYINQQLSVLGIKDFEKTIHSLAFKVFDSSEYNLSSDETELLKYIFHSGTYGDSDTFYKNRLEKLQGSKKPITAKTKLKYIGKRLFPPAEIFENKYPLLYRYKFLIPLSLPYRAFKTLVNNREEILNEIRIILKLK